MRFLKNTWIISLILTTMAFLLWIFLFKRQIAPTGPGIIGGDPSDYAQIAKNLLEGKGFTTNVSFAVPLDFYKNINKLTPPWPDVWRDPFLTASIAFMYKIFGIGDFAVIFTSGLYYVLSSFLIFWTTKKLSNLPTAILATLIWITLPGALSSSFRAYKEQPTTFLVLLIILSLTYVSKRKINALLIGLTLGLYYLLKSSLAFPFLISILIYFIFIIKQKKLIFIFFVG
ncbi:MAG: glycosyltransferase family 39 protein, partial [Patescibacteria group bacterium]|nr:glycosyltransferase family 39 protein [Patescibacteria group bacterium]